MNFSLYILGTPNGYDQYPLDTNNKKFQNEIASCRTESRLSIFRDNQLMQYIFVRKVSGSNSLYLGFALVLTGVYCTDCHALNDLFDDAFYDILLQGELLRFQKDKYNYRIAKFVDNPNEIKRVNLFFETKIDNELNRLFSPIPTSFQIGKGEFTLSLKETSANINVAVSQYDIVHLTNEEKSVSELERTQQMLSALYAEHGALKAKYRKVLNQKRNFKLVVILSLILLCCITGFWLFNEVLNDKNIEIRELKQEITSQSEANEKLSNTNKELHSLLSDTERKLAKTDSIQKITKDSLHEQITENSNLQRRLNNANEEIDILESNIKLAREQLWDNQKTINNLKNNSGERYKVWAANNNYAYIYYQYGSQYSRTSYTVSDNTILRVYHIENGYAMTNVGYLKTNDIKKL